VQRPIPVWFGAASERAYARVGRLADGWFPQMPPDSRLAEARQVIAAAAEDAGRDPATIAMEGRVSWSDADTLVDHVGRWRSAGASHVSINTMRCGLGSVDGHLAALAEAADALGLTGARSAPLADGR
jgi:alkanesulfonate monooxygenase SsuD/methylene tetrahydromethanopterin reductase-like flavin-dependent oxidoreductase (luciferase family)